jgi:hypothetical protein
MAMSITRDGPADAVNKFDKKAVPTARVGSRLPAVGSRIWLNENGKQKFSSRLSVIALLPQTIVTISNNNDKQQ